MEYDINQPWLTLDPWQKEYIETPPEINCYILKGRQCGGTTAMSIKAVELCMKHFKKGEVVFLNSLTERQAFLIITKALIYAKAYYKATISRGKDKPTMHKILFENGTGILAYAAGEGGDSTRGYTVKKLMVDEGSRMGEEYFVASLPTLSVSKGSLDIGSTPNGKKTKEGEEKFFYKCSLDKDFKKFYINAQDCPRHDKEFLKKQKEKISKLAYAQEYEAIFTDNLLRLYSDDLIKEACILKRKEVRTRGKFYLGSDIAGYGDDECTYEIGEKMQDGTIEQRERIIEKRNKTTDTTRKIIELNNQYQYIKKIGVDDGGVGFGVYCELMDFEGTKRKTIALNNSSRPTDLDGEKSKKILKEEMYFNLLTLMENKKIKLLDDNEVKASLSSVQFEEEKIFASYGHVTEGIVRFAWLASKDKDLNIFAHLF